MVGETLGGDAAAVVADEGDGDQVAAPRLRQRRDDVGRAAAGRERDQRVAGLAVGDHLALEDDLGADVVADRGDDRAVLGQVDRRPRRPARVGREAQVGDQVGRVGRRAAVAERQQLAAGVEAAAQLGRRRQQRPAPLRQRPLAQRRHLLGLGQDRGADVGDHPLEVALPLGEEGVEEAGGAGVVDRTGLAPLEQAAVLEEDVDRLPEHVVGGLDQLLADARVDRPRRQLPLRPGALLEGDRQAAALAGQRQPLAHLAAAVLARAEGEDDVLGPRQQGELLAERAAVAGQPERRQRPLADDHRVDELDGDVAHVRARRRREPDRDQPPAAGEALGHPVAEPRQRLGARLEVGAARPPRARRAARRAAPRRWRRRPPSRPWPA